MITMDIKEIAEAINGHIHLDAFSGDASSLLITNVSTDSRQVVYNGLFVAIKGERVDGHNFLNVAKENGYIVALVDHDMPHAPLPYIVVDNTVEALGQLAQHNIDVRYHNESPFTLIGLTGSVGKTTTKDLLKTILSEEAPTVAPVGSFNNEIGLPLTALHVNNDTHYFVAEMGASHLGEIRSLTQIAPPTIGIELKVGTAHVGEFGGVENIYEAKSELVEALPEQGFALLNANDPYIVRMAQRTSAAVRWFGIIDDESMPLQTTEPLSVYASHITLDDCGRPQFRLTFTSPSEEYDIHLGLVGRHNVMNAVAAATAAYIIGVPTPTIVHTLNTSTALSPHRMAVQNIHLNDRSFTILDDTFNANPDSMRAALNGLLSLKKNKDTYTIAILGPMFELGAGSEQMHADIGYTTAQLGVNTLLAVGVKGNQFGQELAHSYAEGAQKAHTNTQIFCVEDIQQAETQLMQLLQEHDDSIVLFKGSHASQLSEFVNHLLSL